MIHPRAASTDKRREFLGCNIGETSPIPETLAYKDASILCILSLQSLI